MLKQLIITALFSFILMIPSQSEAFLIVDTGQPGINPPAWNLQQGFQEGMAGGFNIDQPYTINSIEAWFRNTNNGSGLPFQGTVTMSLFGTKKDLANGDVPDLNKKFYSSVFNVTPGNGADWYGLSNLNWSVQDPGKYFAAFEILPGNTYAGFMPFPNPLIFNGNSTAGRPANSVEWGSAGPLSIGLRVDASPIPEPSTLLLLGSGLISAFVKRKFI